MKKKVDQKVSDGQIEKLDLEDEVAREIMESLRAKIKKTREEKT